VHEVVESNRSLQQVVDTTHNAENTKGENPDTNDGDNAGMRVLEPTKESEKGSDNVDEQDGTAQLPRWDGRPEWTVGTSDKDEPVLSQGDFEEEDFIKVTKVLNDTSIPVATS